MAKYESDADREARIAQEELEMDELRDKLHDEDIEAGRQWPQKR